MTKPGCVTHCYDNGGATFDRYTIYLDWPKNSDGSTPCLGLSDNPSHPQGFSQFCNGFPGRHNGRTMEWDELPVEIRQHIIDRLEQE